MNCLPRMPNYMRTNNDHAHYWTNQLCCVFDYGTEQQSWNLLKMTKTFFQYSRKQCRQRSVVFKIYV